MMPLGYYLLTNDSTNGTDFFTTWDGREGARLVVTIQVLASAGSGSIASLDARLETKNMDESDGDAVNLGASESISLTNDVTSCLLLK